MYILYHRYCTYLLGKKVATVMLVYIVLPYYTGIPVQIKIRYYVPALCILYLVVLPYIVLVNELCILYWYEYLVLYQYLGPRTTT